MRRLAGAALLAAAGLVCAAAAPAFQWRLAAGVTPPPVPAANPMSAAKVELGRRLFYDADLSIDGTLACASCHLQHRGFAEGVATRAGVKGALGRRNAPGLANVAYLSPLTWADPGEISLEAQVRTPVMGEHPVEMGMAGQEAEIARRFGQDACYRSMFEAAFPQEPISLATVSKAIAAFERTLISVSAPYDLHRRGDEGALDAGARRGEAVFQAQGCAACHSGPNFTDGRFHVAGAVRGGDEGAFEKTADPAHRGAFRTPSLRNVQLTEPYLHDGSAGTLRAAILAHAPGRLTDGDVLAIEAFLASLTDRQFVTDERFALPRSFCGQAR